MKWGLASITCSLVLAAAIGGLAGCSSGSPAAPEEVPAPWQFLTYAGTGLEGSTLRIEGDGSLSIEGGDSPDQPALGMLSTAAWQSVRDAAERAQFEVIDGARMQELPGIGFVRLGQDGLIYGFSWAREYDLSAAQLDLVNELRSIWEQANAPIDLRMAEVPITLLHYGLHAAMIEPREAVIRDEDALLKLIAEALPGEAVVLPPIDFDGEMVVALFLGAQRPQSNLEFMDKASWTVGGDLRLPVNVVETIGPCDRSTSPFGLVRMPKSDSSVFFIRYRSTGSCE